MNIFTHNTHISIILGVMIRNLLVFLVFINFHLICILLELQKNCKRKQISLYLGRLFYLHVMPGRLLQQAYCLSQNVYLLSLLN